MVSAKQVKPFFSVITCTRNSASYLPACLASVQGQTFRDFEHIVIDGHSTDGTLRLLRKSGLSVISSPPRGIAAAMNVGIRHAQGKYLFFLHSDDSFYRPDVLAKVNTFLKTNPSLDWAFGRIHEVTGEGKTVGYPPKRRIFQGRHPHLLKFYNYIPHQATFVHKAIFEKYGGFDESLKSMMDDDLWLRLAPSTSWDFMPIVVANYSIRKDSQSESPTNKKSNNLEYESVQTRYLTKLEMFLARLINRLLS